MNINQLTQQIRYLDINTNRLVNEVFAGNYKSSFKGQGLEIKNLRKYEPGDDIKHIDWITSSKEGELFIKEYQETRERTTILVIDTSASMNFTSTGTTKKQVTIETAAILLFSALKTNDKFGLILFNNQTQLYLPPQKGKVHLLRILREIVIAFENNHRTTTDQNHSLSFFNQIVKKHSICFLISDDIDTSQQQNLKIINQKHDFVVIQIIDPFEQQITAQSAISLLDYETNQPLTIDLNNQTVINNYNLLRHQKYLNQQQVLKKHAIDHVIISTPDNIYKQLLIFFKKRQLLF